MKTMCIAMAAAAALLAATANASSTGRCGGTGGDRSKTLTCPEGQYIVGFGARYGVYVDSISIRCAAFDSAGKRKSPGDWKTAGGSGGTLYKDGQCSGDRALTYFEFSSGGYVDKARSGRCFTRQAEGGFGGSVKDFTVDGGGPGGIYCGMQCPTGEALYEVTVKSGGWVDSIKGKCRS